MLRAVLLSTLILGGCAPRTSETVVACERIAAGKLRSATTYKRIGAYEFDAGGERHTLIQYDAANARGTSIKQFCDFPLRGGEADIPNLVDPAADVMPGDVIPVDLANGTQ
jgi:hypothetical protein